MNQVVGVGEGGAKMGQTVHQSMPFNASYAFVHAVVIYAEPSMNTWGWGLTNEILQHNRRMLYVLGEGVQMELARITKGSVKSIKPCSTLEFDAYKSHIDNVVDAGRTMDLFEILRSAHADYFEHVAGTVGMHLSSGDVVNPYSMDKFSIDTGRYFLNYLTAMRVFLDHAEVRLKRKFGKESVESEHLRQLQLLSSIAGCLTDCFIS